MIKISYIWIYIVVVFVCPLRGQKVITLYFFIYFRLKPYTQKKKLLNELKKIRVNFSTKFNYIFPPKSNLFEMTCCNLVV